jgi:hypothetical protein
MIWNLSSKIKLYCLKRHVKSVYNFLNIFSVARVHSQLVRSYCTFYLQNLTQTPTTRSLVLNMMLNLNTNDDSSLEQNLTNYYSGPRPQLSCKQKPTFFTWQVHWSLKNLKGKVKLSCKRLWRPIWLWDVEASAFSKQSAHRWRWGCQLPFNPREIPGTHSC